MNRQLRARKIILLDILLILFAAAFLIFPLFRAKYLDNWGSIESTFISDARFLIENWPHPQWQPLWYAGTRFDYIYPPALRYGTALISKATGLWPVQAYHIYTAFFYCVGIAGVYLLLAVGNGSRRVALLGAAASALMSPSFLFMTPLRHDAWKWEPLRLGVLVKYGEGPHMTALAFIPIALAFSWIALDSLRPGYAALAGVLCAAVVSNNFYGATALGIFYPILVWSFWITRKERRIVIPGIAIPLIAYGLAAFWLVPSYWKITAQNMQYVSRNGSQWSVWLALAVAVLFVLISAKWSSAKPERTWAVFAAGAAVFFSLNVLGAYYFNFRVSGEPHRLAPELDMVLILAAATAMQWIWSKPGLAPRAFVSALVAATFATTAGYIGNAWRMFPPRSDYRNRVEFQVSDWLASNMPDARIMANGSVRFWFDAWHDLPDIGGGSEQGLINSRIIPAYWEARLGPKPEPTVLWMQCLGVDAIYVSDKRSQEIYKDFIYPEKLNGALPVIYDNGRGDRIYRVPRRYPARARVVDARLLHGLEPGPTDVDLKYLRSYADVIERGPNAPPVVIRRGADQMTVRAGIGPGQSLIVQETYDPAWHAWCAGQELRVRRDPMGFMVIDAPPGQREIELQFVTPLENIAGRIVTGVTMIAVIALLALDALWKLRRGKAPAPFWRGR
jgi:hypothetical protein